MFKITVASEDDKTVTLRLDGRVIGECVSELKELCQLYKNVKHKRLSLDFSGVTFIDDEVVRALEKIKDDRTKIINCSLFIETLLDNLMGNKKK